LAGVLARPPQKQEGEDRLAAHLEGAKRSHDLLGQRDDLRPPSIAGEEQSEIECVIDDLVAIRCDILTLGQYLQPTANHLPVERWVHPDEFADWKVRGEARGIRHVESGPLVRSSYHAEKQVHAHAGT
jgi:lipoic acid synthetase